MKTTKNIHTGHRQRLRELAIKSGLTNLPEHQILEYLLSFIVAQQDVNETAHNLINKFGSLNNVFNASLKELMNVKGVGEISATFLSTLKELFSIISKETPIKRIYLTNPFQTSEFFKKIFKNSKTEETYLALIDANNKLIEVEKISDGIDDSSQISIRDIFKILNKNQCNRFILAHYHTTESVLPSKNDIDITRSLFFSSKFADYVFYDHMIISNNGYYSFTESGEFEKFDNEFEKIKNLPFIEYKKQGDNYGF